MSAGTSAAAEPWSAFTAGSELPGGPQQSRQDHRHQRDGQPDDPPLHVVIGEDRPHRDTDPDDPPGGYEPHQQAPQPEPPPLPPRQPVPAPAPAAAAATRTPLAGRSRRP